MFCFIREKLVSIDLVLTRYLVCLHQRLDLQIKALHANQISEE